MRGEREQMDSQETQYGRLLAALAERREQGAESEKQADAPSCA